MTRPTPGIEEPKPLEVQPDGQMLVNTIMRRYGMCEPNITGPRYFKQALTAWWATVKPIAGSLWWTTQAEYNPIENYDRFEKRDYSDQDNKDENTKTDNTDTMKGDNTYIKSVSAFNDPGFQPADKNEEDLSNRSTLDGTTAYKTNNSFTHDETARIHGNIGVTTTQQMLESERQLVMFNWYETIAKMFAEEFLLLVW